MSLKLSGGISAVHMSLPTVEICSPHYGGLGIAVALDAIEPPVAIFIAAIPFLKMLNRSKAPERVCFIGQVLDGAAKPVGGSSEATIQFATAGEAPRAGGDAKA